MFKVSYALEKKGGLLGLKKGCAKSHVHCLGLLAHPLGEF